MTTSAWGEIGRLQPDYPGKQILRSAEVITYHGHFGNHASLRYVDHRTGPVYERAANGALRLLRPATPPRTRFAEIHRAGGFVEVNHPRIFFPSTTPGFAAFCRGCPWEFSDAATDWNAVDALEISTGPPNFGAAPSQFMLQAIALYDDLIARGHHLAAVAVSDSHDAGRFDAGSRPVGTGTTVVRARRLSERGVVAAVRAGHTYAKPFGNAGPDLRLVARVRKRRVGIMGDTVRARAVTLVARVLGGERPAAPSTTPRTLAVLRDGRPYRSVAVGADDPSGAAGRSRRLPAAARARRPRRGRLHPGVGQAVTPAGVAAQLAIGPAPAATRCPPQPCSGFDGSRSWFARWRPTEGEGMGAQWNDGRRFEGRVALVTGGGGTLGGAVARGFGSEGALVALGYRSSRSQAADVVAEVEGRGGRAHSGHLDVTDQDSVDAFVADIAERYGRLDVLVNRRPPRRGGHGEIQ